MSTQINLRESPPGEDCEAIAAISNAVFPEYRHSADEVRYDDEHFDRTKYVYKRYVAVEPQREQIVAFGEYYHMPNMFHPQKFWVYICVHPDRQRQGLGTRIYEQILQDLQSLKAIAMHTSAREDMKASVEFLTKRGFKEQMRSWESRLHLPEFDFSNFEYNLDPKITISTLVKEQKNDPNCYQKLYELVTLIMEDVPHPDTYTPVPFEHFMQFSIQHPDSIPEGWFIAKDSDKYVGMSNLFRSFEEPRDLYQGLTGVRREYRRRGIAMTLKLRTIEYAKQHGYKIIKTWNETGNVGMLKINEKLGFVRQPAWISFYFEL